MYKNTIKTITLKGVSLFLYLNVVRVIVVLIALYFSALFIFNTEKTYQEVLSEWPFHIIILASLLSISAGYIIHHFYEEELLRLQKPFQTYFKSFLSKREYLTLYIALNTISLTLAYMVSWRMLLFFLGYQFLIWLYAHKLRTRILIANLSKTILTLLPFFALMYYFQNFSFKVVSFGVLLFILVFLKEFLKDFSTINTDQMFEHQSVPNTFGEKKAFPYLCGLLVLAMVLNLFLAIRYQLGIMEVYLYSSALIYLLILIILHTYSPKKYQWSLVILKIWIFVGVLSIPFINWNIQEVINRI